ncbi:putative membrane protein YdjX (TVP38/TMEM64 family) [Arenicella xantha]|uniref:TVP38/TMEM64 family membrane protein n=1 Tax=Arenicella xantha TaxID=644221 RepID=A0A395JH82_9GAMM|nr:TVP38/TMEM64 family protein [Arenicella xantha]RBP48899.1 putative membrane protein YdjX (TVP38/TMEM64 family) [Arenicella xantha]
MNSKLILAAIVVALIGAFFAFDLGQYFSLANLKEQQEALNAYFQQHKLLVIVVFFIGYVAVAGLGLPAAAIMTLAAGAIFGFWTGLILVSFASTIGATIAFLLTRYLFHDAVEAKFGDKLKKLNQGIEREGAMYIFSIRLVPFIPFFVINSVMGLTSLKTVTFYWASQLGMLLGTAVYVNAGTQLATIETMGDIVDIRIVLSFLLLAVFPFIAKKLLTLVKGKDALPGENQ